MTEQTMTVIVTRKVGRRTVELAFGENDFEDLTLVGSANNPNDKDKFEELADIVPDLHALDNNALRAWTQQKSSGQNSVAPATASNEFAVPDDTMSALRRFRLRYINPS
jgi:hypothetical protein